MEWISGLTVIECFPLEHDELTDALEIMQGRCEILLWRNLSQALSTRSLEVHRDTAGERRESVDLGRLGSGHQLDVDVSAEPMAFPEELENLDQVVHDLDRPPRDARGDEKSLAPSPAVRLEKDPHQLFRLEQSAWHRPIPAHGAVVAVIAAGVG